MGWLSSLGSAIGGIVGGIGRGIDDVAHGDIKGVGDDIKSVGRDFDDGVRGIVPGGYSTLLKFTPLAPAAYAYDAYNAIKNKNYVGLGMSLFGTPGSDALGGALSSGLGVGAQAVNALASGAIGGTASSLTGGNFAKGAFTSGLGSLYGSMSSNNNNAFTGVGDTADAAELANNSSTYGQVSNVLKNPAQSLGVDSPTWQTAVNSTVNGAITGGLKGDTAKGAVGGAISGGVTTGLNMFGDDTLNKFGGTNNQQNYSVGGEAPSYNPFAQQSTPGTTFGVNNNQIGQSVAGGLMGLYAAHQAKQALNGQISSIQGLFGPNSAYSQQMQEQLARKDAAAGRRSQYGNRAVELQARLAEQAGRMAPQLQALYGAKQQQNMSQYKDIYAMLRNTGLLNKLSSTAQNYFSPQQQVPMPSPTIPDYNPNYGGLEGSF